MQTRTIHKSPCIRVPPHVLFDALTRQGNMIYSFYDTDSLLPHALARMQAGIKGEAPYEKREASDGMRRVLEEIMRVQNFFNFSQKLANWL